MEGSEHSSVHFKIAAANLAYFISITAPSVSVLGRLTTTVILTVAELARLNFITCS